MSDLIHYTKKMQALKIRCNLLLISLINILTMGLQNQLPSVYEKIMQAKKNFYKRCLIIIAATLNIYLTLQALSKYIHQRVQFTKVKAIAKRRQYFWQAFYTPLELSRY